MENKPEDLVVDPELIEPLKQLARPIRWEGTARLTSLKDLIFIHEHAIPYDSEDTHG